MDGMCLAIVSWTQKMIEEQYRNGTPTNTRTVLLGNIELPTANRLFLEHCVSSICNSVSLGRRDRDSYSDSDSIFDQADREKCTNFLIAYKKDAQFRDLSLKEVEEWITKAKSVLDEACGTKICLVTFGTYESPISGIVHKIEAALSESHRLVEIENDEAYDCVADTLSALSETSRRAVISRLMTDLEMESDSEQ